VVLYRLRANPFRSPPQQDGRHCRAVSIHPARRVDFTSTIGIDVINQIKIENPDLWTKVFQEEVRAMIRTAAELERRMDGTPCARAFIGLKRRRALRNLHALHRQSFAVPQLGLSRVFDDTKNPFRGCGSEWTSKKKDFLKTRVMSYQNGGALKLGVIGTAWGSARL